MGLMTRGRHMMVISALGADIIYIGEV